MSTQVARAFAPMTDAEKQALKVIRDFRKVFGPGIEFRAVSEAGHAVQTPGFRLPPTKHEITPSTNHAKVPK
ncbi:MAG TPA: hypothetical protein VN023_09480 [Methylovorus sp.]|nr:hypothetical protein [Methylovorus sp.]